MNGAAFLDVPEEKRIAVLERLAQKEKAAETPAEKFFGELKGWTARGYYTSKIGIHQEMEYKGNMLQDDYAGIDAGSRLSVGAPAAGDASVLPERRVLQREAPHGLDHAG